MKKILFIYGLTLTAILHAHDFDYYKEKTLAMLPILGIDKADVTFVVTHKSPTFEQRSKNPTTIFINIEDLNQLPDTVALFGCAFSAQLTTLDWQKITNRTLYVEYLGSVTAGLAIGSLISSPIPLCTYLVVNETFFLKGSVALGLISIPLFVLTKGLYEHMIWSRMVFYIHTVKVKIIDTIYTLLTNPTTASLAFVGFEHNLKNIPTHCYFGGPDNTTIEDVAHSKQGVLLKLNEWIQTHPNQWAEIKKTLKPATIELFATPS